MTAPPATLAAYSDAELGEFYNATAHDLTEPIEAWRRTIEAELDRRDAAERARQAPRRTDPVAGEWRDMAHAQYLAAERELKGNLVARGAPETDAFQLWAGPERIARQHATEELRNWWDVNGRITVTGYRDQVATQKRSYNDARLAAVQPFNHDQDAPRSLIPGPAQNHDELAEPSALPDWLANRDGEVRGPILAVAAIAGDDWPDRAMNAAAELCGAWEQPSDDGADFMGGLADLTAGW